MRPRPPCRKQLIAKTKRRIEEIRASEDEWRKIIELDDPSINANGSDAACLWKEKIIALDEQVK